MGEEYAPILLGTAIAHGSPIIKSDLLRKIYDNVQKLSDWIKPLLNLLINCLVNLPKL